MCGCELMDTYGGNSLVPMSLISFNKINRTLSFNKLQKKLKFSYYFITIYQLKLDNIFIFKEKNVSKKINNLQRIVILRNYSAETFLPINICKMTTA